MTDKYDVMAIDAVVNPATAEIAALRPEWAESFYLGKIGRDSSPLDGVSQKQLLEKMDQAGIERSFLIAAKVGQFSDGGAELR